MTEAFSGIVDLPGTDLHGQRLPASNIFLEAAAEYENGQMARVTLELKDGYWTSAQGGKA